MSISETRFNDAERLGTTRRRALGAMAGGALAALAVGAKVAAQDGTPAAGACGDPSLMSAVKFISVDGVEVGQITIVESVDPFSGYRPNSPPPRGNRFIILNVGVENTGTNPWQFDPGRIVLQDAEGFLTSPTSVDLGDPPIATGLGYQEIPLGTSVQGVVGYAMLKGVDPVRIFYVPAGDRLILLADLR